MALDVSDLSVRSVRLHVARLGCRMSAARSHTDRGQLFGWDGASMWVEQSILDADLEHITFTGPNDGRTCPRCQQIATNKQTVTK